MKQVLFVGTHDAGRSQMARAFFERYAPRDLRAESAGHEPADRVRREVVWAMQEVGIDISERRPEKMTVEMQLHADWSITLASGGGCPYVPTTVEAWAIPDPAGKSMEEVRSIRDAVAARVEDLVETRLDAIRSDRTAHQWRLERILPELIREFEGVRSDTQIRSCTDAVLADYKEGPRSFVMTIAQRRVRECLSRERCDVSSV